MCAKFPSRSELHRTVRAERQLEHDPVAAMRQRQSWDCHWRSLVYGAHTMKKTVIARKIAPSAKDRPSELVLVLVLVLDVVAAVLTDAGADEAGLGRDEELGA